MRKNNEKQLRNLLFSEIRSIAPKYRCGVEVPVPYQHIYVPNRGHNVLQIWCFKQDIVFYEPLFTRETGYKESRIVGDRNDTLVDIVLEKDTAQNSKDVAMPFVVIETKLRQPNSHDIITYSDKFEKIKTIFPFCKFVFCVFEKIAPRTYRHGVSFDKIVCINDINNKAEINDFKKVIRELLKQARTHLGNLHERPIKPK